MLIIIFLSFITLFIFTVQKEERTNVKNLKTSPSYTLFIEENKKVYLPKASDMAISYKITNLNIWSIDLMLSFLIPILFIISGLSVKLRNFSHNKTKSFILIVSIYFILFTLINYILTFPLNFYSNFINKHNYGLSNQNFVRWFSNSIKDLIISTTIGALFLWLPIVTIKKQPKYWWLHMGLLSIPILLFITFVSPTFIDPLFNKYETIQNKELEKKIYTQLSKTPLDNCKVYQVNKSIDTKEMNAYMTGIFNSKRIVLWDNTINNLTQDETLCILAHEMGHYLMGHVWKSIILGSILITFILYIVNKLCLYIINNWSNILGFNQLFDVAAIPLIILFINFMIFITNPITNSYSRYLEKEADRFEIELTKDNYSTITSTIKLHEESLTLPHPSKLYKIWYFSHPPYYERIKFANEYMPWQQNKPLKYEKYIN
ncbi:M48 family metallopeptidase [Clostridium rectalis]|uniref:M48 family metallopeptidase n=1 Tax=Clostridium rectalis TaxID=2040295 RepID=UPI000F643103|nr:M48 family metallopeptidase [Clostridium rectalis]